MEKLALAMLLSLIFSPTVADERFVGIWEMQHDASQDSPPQDYEYLQIFEQNGDYLSIFSSDNSMDFYGNQKYEIEGSKLIIRHPDEEPYIASFEFEGGNLILKPEGEDYTETYSRASEKDDIFHASVNLGRTGQVRGIELIYPEGYWLFNASAAARVDFIEKREEPVVLFEFAGSRLEGGITSAGNALMMPITSEVAIVGLADREFRDSLKQLFTEVTGKK